MALLRAAHAAIKHADPGATVVLGALTNSAWKSIGQIYQVPGAHGLFDMISVNAFTATPSNELLFLHLVRDAASSSATPTSRSSCTEISWPSASGKSPQHPDWNTTESGQAQKHRHPAADPGRRALARSDWPASTGTPGWVRNTTARRRSTSAAFCATPPTARSSPNPRSRHSRAARWRSRAAGRTGRVAGVCVKSP